MTTLAVRRPHLPMPMIVALAAATWTVAWFANLALGRVARTRSLADDIAEAHG